jgi:hypothetical protein
MFNADTAKPRPKRGPNRERANPLCLVVAIDGSLEPASVEAHRASLRVCRLADQALGHAPSVSRRPEAGRCCRRVPPRTAPRPRGSFAPARAGAVRLRNDRSGSFIGALRCNTSESRCAVSYALRSRDPRGPWASPSGGRILLFDVDSFRVVGSVEAPGWVDDLTLMSNDRVCGRNQLRDVARSDRRGAAPAVSPAAAGGAELDVTPPCSPQWSQSPNTAQRRLTVWN